MRAGESGPVLAPDDGGEVLVGVRLVQFKNVGWPRTSGLYAGETTIPQTVAVSPTCLGVTFKIKDYRIEGPGRYKTMTLATGEFIRRFLTHVLPKGFHRIRHDGLFASAGRANNIARACQLLAAPQSHNGSVDAELGRGSEPPAPSHPCPCCGGRMIIIETFARGSSPPRYRPAPPTIVIRNRHLMTTMVPPQRQLPFSVPRWSRRRSPKRRSSTPYVRRSSPIDAGNNRTNQPLGCLRNADSALQPRGLASSTPPAIAKSP